MSVPSRCMLKLRQVWWAATDLAALAWACRAPFAAVAIGGLLIALADQARDIVIGTASFADGGLPIPFAVLLWATASWYWARITLEFLDGEALRWKPAQDPEVAAWGWPAGWHRFWSNQLPRIIGAAAIFSVSYAFWRAWRIYALYGDGAPGEGFLWRAAAYLVATIVFYVVVAWRREIATWLVHRLGGNPVQSSFVPQRQALQKFTDLPRGAQALLYLSVLASPVFFFLFALAPIATSDAMGSAVAIVLFGLALAVSLPSFLAIWSIRTKFPFFGIACLAFLFMPSWFGDNHDVRTCRDLEGQSGACIAADHKSRPFVRDVYTKWHAANAQITRPIEAPANGPVGAPPASVAVPPMVFVASAGGASRAAFFTSQVLGEIAKREPQFAERVFLLSGVSGGSLGATLFRSLVEADRRASPDRMGSPLLAQAPDDAKRFIDSDFLAPALGVGFYVDGPYSPFSFLSGWWAPNDRAVALEKAWEAAWLRSGVKQGTPAFAWSDGLVRTFTRDADRPWPILALNGTSVEKGKRIVTSNVRFWTGTATDPLNISGGINRYDGLDILEADIPISTAVTMSARFPVISPAGGMRDGKGKLVTRVIDGGLFENFGAVLADESIRYLVERIKEAQNGERPAIPLAILISSDPSLDRIDLRPGPPKKGVLPDCLPVAEGPLPHPGNGWEECPVAAASYATLLVDPVRALYDGRVARGELAATALRDRVEGTRIMIRDRLTDKFGGGTGRTVKREILDLVQARIGLDDHTDFFHFRQCRVPGAKSPTMSWHDSENAWAAMRSMLGLYPASDGIVHDPCGNKVEFFRLCVRLARLSGRVDDDEAGTRWCKEEGGWPEPVGWTCDPVPGHPRPFCRYRP